MLPTPLLYLITSTSFRAGVWSSPAQDILIFRPSSLQGISRQLGNSNTTLHCQMTFKLWVTAPTHIHGGYDSMHLPNRVGKVRPEPLPTPLGSEWGPMSLPREARLPIPNHSRCLKTYTLNLCTFLANECWWNNGQVIQDWQTRVRSSPTATGSLQSHWV